jgi:hypothetical protein
VKHSPDEDVGPQKRSSRFGERRPVPAGVMGGKWSVRNNIKTKQSAKCDQTYLRNMMLGKDSHHEVCEADIRDAEMVVEGREADRGSLSAAAMVVLIAITWWMERRGAAV